MPLQKRKSLRKLINSLTMSTYQKKNLIKYTNMRHLIEQLVIIIRVNITKLTSKKSNNILKNQSQ